MLDFKLLVPFSIYSDCSFVGWLILLSCLFEGLACLVLALRILRLAMRKLRRRPRDGGGEKKPRFLA